MTQQVGRFGKPLQLRVKTEGQYASEYFHPEAILSLLHCLTRPAKCPLSGPVAQLDRASDYESEGRAFESLRVHHLLHILIRVKNLNDTCRQGLWG